MHALAGGVLIGLGTLLATVATGKPVGISGAFSKVLRLKKGETLLWLVFLVGLAGGLIVAGRLDPAALVFRSQRSLSTLAVAGLLVGFGTRLGGGCTSGYGVTGIGLGSKSGLVATLVFVAAGMLTVFAINRFSGGGLG